MAMAALISVTPLLAPSLSMSWTSRTRISSLTRGPSLAAGCGGSDGATNGSLSPLLLRRDCYAMSRRPASRTYDGQLFGDAGRQCPRSGVFARKSTTMRLWRPCAGGIDKYAPHDLCPGPKPATRSAHISGPLPLSPTPDPPAPSAMNDNSLKFLDIGEGAGRPQHCRAPAEGRRPGSVLAVAATSPT